MLTATTGTSMAREAARCGAGGRCHGIYSTMHVAKEMGLLAYLLFNSTLLDSWATSTWITFFKRGYVLFKGKWS